MFHGCSGMAEALIIRGIQPMFSPSICIGLGENCSTELQKWLEPRVFATFSLFFSHGFSLQCAEAETAVFHSTLGVAVTQAP